MPRGTRAERAGGQGSAPPPCGLVVVEVSVVVVVEVSTVVEVRVWTVVVVVETFTLTLVGLVCEVLVEDVAAGAEECELPAPELLLPPLTASAIATATAATATTASNPIHIPERSRSRAPQFGQVSAWLETGVPQLGQYRMSLGGGGCCGGW